MQDFIYCVNVVCKRNRCMYVISLHDGQDIYKNKQLIKNNQYKINK